jgi:hypothetical protein
MVCKPWSTAEAAGRSTVPGSNSTTRISRLFFRSDLQRHQFCGCGSPCDPFRVLPDAFDFRPPAGTLAIFLCVNTLAVLGR